MATIEPNVWSPHQAAQWAGVPHRRLLDFFHDGLLPAIPIGVSQTQKMQGGRKRKRRVSKWIVPRLAFIKAWENFSGPPPAPNRAVG